MTFIPNTTELRAIIRAYQYEASSQSVRFLGTRMLPIIAWRFEDGSNVPLPVVPGIEQATDKNIFCWAVMNELDWCYPLDPDREPCALADFSEFSSDEISRIVELQAPTN